MGESTFDVSVVPPDRITVTVTPPNPSLVGGVAVSSRVVQILSRGERKVGIAATAKGPPGERGPQGIQGLGLPPGGTVGQILVKSSVEDYNTGWKTMFYFGTGDPPDPAGLPEGALYFKLEV